MARISAVVRPLSFGITCKRLFKLCVRPGLRLVCLLVLDRNQFALSRIAGDPRHSIHTEREKSSQTPHTLAGGCPAFLSGSFHHTVLVCQHVFGFDSCKRKKSQPRTVIPKVFQFTPQPVAVFQREFTTCVLRFLRIQKHFNRFLKRSSLFSFRFRSLAFGDGFQLCLQIRLGLHRLFGIHAAGNCDSYVFSVLVISKLLRAQTGNLSKLALVLAIGGVDQVEINDRYATIRVEG